MTDSRSALIAYIATLLAIVALATCGAYALANDEAGSAGAFAGAVTGLIGVIGTFRPRGSSNVIENVETANVSKEAS